MIVKRYPICMEIAGNTALWTRPDSGDSPVSYIAPTYSAVKGIFEAILWGPTIEIIPTRVDICAPIQWSSYVTNYTGPLRSSDQIKKDSSYQLYATVLTDVCYRLYADVIISPRKDQMSEKAAQWDQKTTSPGHAYQAIFNRRLERGQAYGCPCLGWKEFTPSYFGPFRNGTSPCTGISEIIPSMLREVFPGGHHSACNPIYDTDVEVIEGVLIYPERRTL